MLSLAAIIGWISRLIAARFIYMKGRGDVENKNLKEENERMRNRPRTDDDVNGLFRKLIKAAKKRDK